MKDPRDELRALAGLIRSWLEGGRHPCRADWEQVASDLERIEGKLGGGE